MGCALDRRLKRGWRNNSSSIRTARTRQKLPSFYITTYDHNQGRREERLRVRVGLRTGELVQHIEDFFSRNVILASRIADQARGV